MYSCGPPHMDVQEWDDQHELTYSSYVRTRDVTLKTCRRRWMIGRNGERRSGISALVARHDDDDDMCVLLFFPSKISHSYLLILAAECSFDNIYFGRIIWDNRIFVSKALVFLQYKSCSILIHISHYPEGHFSGKEHSVLSKDFPLFTLLFIIFLLCFWIMFHSLW